MGSETFSDLERGARGKEKQPMVRSYCLRTILVALGLTSLAWGQSAQPDRCPKPVPAERGTSATGTGEVSSESQRTITVEEKDMPARK